jgi:hypothetical protein
MDWLKKYYEKLSLAGALLLLIGVAGGLLLKINSLNEEINQSLHPELANRPTPPISLTTYSNTAAALQSPPQWTNSQPAALFPPVLVVVSVTKTTPVTTAEPPKPLLTLESTFRRPFPLQFKRYTYDAKKNIGKNFQINLTTQNYTFFIDRTDTEIADRHIKTGYRIIKFEHKTVMVDVSGIGKRETDVSELTVKREGEDPIVLAQGRTATFPKWHARIHCSDKSIECSTGETFESGERTYKVLDVTNKAVVLQDLKSGEKQTLSVSTTQVTP